MADGIIQRRMDNEAEANDTIGTQDFQHTQLSGTNENVLEMSAGDVVREKLLARARGEQKLGVEEASLRYGASQLGSNQYKVNSMSDLRGAARREVERRQSARRQGTPQKESRIEKHERLKAGGQDSSTRLDADAILKKIDEAANQGQGQGLTRSSKSSKSSLGERQVGLRAGQGTGDGGVRGASRQSGASAPSRHHFAEPPRRNYNPYE